MQLKITVTVLLLLALPVLVPTVRADSIRAPAPAATGQAVFNHVAVSQIDGVLSRTLVADLPRDQERDSDSDSVPESRSMVPLFLLAGSLLLLRKRLVAH